MKPEHIAVARQSMLLTSAPEAVIRQNNPAIEDVIMLRAFAEEAPAAAWVR